MTGKSVAKTNKPSAVEGGNKSSAEKLGFWSLFALVVGGIIGSGVFNLITELVGDGTVSTFAILIGWGIAAVGMLALVGCFYMLNQKRSDLDAGVYSYAQAGFGKFMGFNSAWGYWISAWLGNVAYGTIIFTSLNYFFGDTGWFVKEDGGFTIWTILGASTFLWLITALVARGVKSAGFVNAVTTFAKMVPIVIFVIAALIAFKLDVFTAEFWANIKDSGNIDFNSLTDQIKSTMIALVFVFIGVEGASTFSGQAKSRKAAGAATIIGFLTVLAFYVLITVLSLGIMQNSAIAGINTENGTAMAQLLDEVTNGWGWIVSVGVIISVVGAWLAWTLFPMQLPYEAAKNGSFPKFFEKTNEKGVPITSLLITGGMTQIFFIICLLSAEPYSLMYELCTVMILVPYLFVALFALKESTMSKKNKSMTGALIAIVALAYSSWLVYAFGWQYLLAMMILYLAGLPLYVLMRKQAKKEIFANVGEWIVAAVILISGICGIWWLFIGEGMSYFLG